MNIITVLKEHCEQQIKDRESMENILKLFDPAQRGFNAGRVETYKEILKMLGKGLTI